MVDEGPVVPRCVGVRPVLADPQAPAALPVTVLQAVRVVLPMIIVWVLVCLALYGLALLIAKRKGW